MAKSSKTNTKTPEWTKFDTLQKAYEAEAIMNYPSKDEWRKRLMFIMEKWADEDDALDMTMLIQRLKMPRKSFYRMLEEHEDVKAIYDEIKLYVGCRKRIGSLKKNFDRESAYKDMHKLDPEYVEINKYWADLKNEEAKNTGTIFIEVPKTKELPDDDRGREEKTTRENERNET